MVLKQEPRVFAEGSPQRRPYPKVTQRLDDWFELLLLGRPGPHLLGLGLRVAESGVEI